MVIFADGKPVKSAPRPTPIESSAFGKLPAKELGKLRRGNRFAARPSKARHPGNPMQMSQAVNKQRNFGNRLATLRNSGRGIPSRSKMMMDIEGTINSQKSHKKSIRPSKPTLNPRETTLRSRANRKPVARSFTASTTNPRGSKPNKGSRKPMRTRKTPLTKDALDQQLNRYFSADPSMYKTQLDRELDEMMHDVSSGQLQQTS